MKAKLLILRAHLDSTTTHEDRAGIGARPLGCRNVRHPGGGEAIPTPSQLSGFCSLKAALLCPVVLSRCALILLCAAAPISVTAQISYTGGAYTQDFDTLKSGTIYRDYTNLPAGWVVSHGSYVWTTVTNGYSNNYGTYCFSSSASDSNKSIGLVIGSTGQAYLGARLHNATGVTLKSFSLSYLAKQWVKGGVTSNDQVIPFSYSLDATNLTSGTYANVTALDMHSINDGDGVYAALNGNVVSNQAFIASTVSGISWLQGQDLWIRWSGVSHPFYSSHALAVDDLSFSAVPKIAILPDGPSQFSVSWSTNYTGYVLESALTPTPPSWDTVTNVPIILDSEFTVRVHSTNAQRFFRLKRQ